MTRLDLLQLLIGQARTNGFKFRRWYVSSLEMPWTDAKSAVEVLARQRRYYALLFSHDFASTFWKPGARMTFQVATQTFTRRMSDGSIGTVVRKGYTRRSTRDDAWRYHLKELALAEDPLRYMRRYLQVADQLEEDAGPSIGEEAGPPIGEEAVDGKLGADLLERQGPTPLI